MAELVQAGKRHEFRTQCLSLRQSLPSECPVWICVTSSIIIIAEVGMTARHTSPV